MSILNTPSGRILPNWSVERMLGGFRIVAPFNDGLPGNAALGNFQYRPHAELAARAPQMAEALEHIRDWPSDLSDSLRELAAEVLK